MFEKSINFWKIIYKIIFFYSWKILSEFNLHTARPCRLIFTLQTNIEYIVFRRCGFSTQGISYFNGTPTTKVIARGVIIPDFDFYELFIGFVKNEIVAIPNWFFTPTFNSLSLLYYRAHCYYTVRVLLSKGIKVFK